jgi:hypothetical protein
MRPLLLAALLLLAFPSARAAERCSHVYAFLGATDGEAPCLWFGEQSTGDCGPLRREGFRLHQVLLRAGRAEVLTSRLRDEYPDWVQLESWLAKSGTLKSRRFEWRDNDWRMDLGPDSLVLTPPRGTAGPGVAGRRAETLRRVKAGPGGETVQRAWYLPDLSIVVVLTRAAGPEDSTIEGYTILKIRPARR